MSEFTPLQQFLFSLTPTDWQLITIYFVSFSTVFATILWLVFAILDSALLFSLRITRFLQICHALLPHLWNSKYIDEIVFASLFFLAIVGSLFVHLLIGRLLLGLVIILGLCYILFKNFRWSRS